MPSSHSATVTALAAAIALQDGAGGPAFAVALVLACVVMYDASGVRLHAGRQAGLLNQIVCEVPPEHPLSNIRPLRDSLGHTPLQGQEEAISFREILASFPNDCRAAGSINDISPHLCFICLLHLANEHGLSIQGCTNLDDLSICFPLNEMRRSEMI